jgi:hypothetical protein
MRIELYIVDSAYNMIANYVQPENVDPIGRLKIKL